MTCPTTLPVTIARWLHDATFWARYHFAGVGEDDPQTLPDAVGRLPLGDGFALPLSLAGDLSSVSLGLVTPAGGEPIGLGFDDQSHGHPHCLRWAELDLVCRLQALADTTLPHPGPVLLLLAQFAPMCDAADAALGRPLLAAAGEWAGVDGGDWWDRADRRSAGFRWTKSDSGWRASQTEDDRGRSGFDMYSLRAGDSDGFPHADSNLAYAVRRACGPAPAPLSLGAEDDA